ncbi:hypothetical protein SAMD00019534_035940 [Acytostelium subglobosum LB1]|uniref:hypothetical protein n=1 Tax=Acytostelium subglobosum LB1 TaxID=1410327 RepID=UPI000644D537|nr:hypothetical protein SAMD00019534_035940 [Acytostelium subglobosum LB1]GAM20419.1 hypothetical protein SAMD00019534_035940 [Acytostelium subglobosum LB1]|eukprot:XP_012759940.1 hypothetical protein SAMD00019534_035940 [Acytostelium subglobosum LB1]
MADIRHLLAQYLPTCSCQSSSCMGAEKERHDRAIMRVLRIRYLFRTIVLVGRPRCKAPHDFTKYKQLDFAQWLMSTRHYYVLIERLLYGEAAPVNWTFEGLGTLIQTMPFALFKHVYDRNRYLMLYHHHGLLHSAAASGRLDVFQVLEAQSHNYPQKKIMEGYCYDPYEYNPYEDYLFIAYIHGHRALFEYLLPHETMDNMERRIKDGSTDPPSIKMAANVNDRQLSDTAHVIKQLITYITDLNQQRKPGSRFTIQQLVHQPFAIVMRCQDVSLAQLAVKHIPFDSQLFQQHCEVVFRPASMSGSESDSETRLDILYGSDWQPGASITLDHSLNFLIEVLALYGMSVPRADSQLATFRQVLNDVGAIYIIVFGLLSSVDARPPLISFIRKGLFMNIDRFCQQSHLQEFLRYFLSLDTNDLGLATVCTYGTLEMVTLSREITKDTGSPHHEQSSAAPSVPVYPKTVAIFEYIDQHHLFSMDSLDMLVHVASTAAPELIRAFLTAFPQFLSNHPDEELDTISINSALSRHNIDTCIAVQSMLQYELDRAKRSELFDCLKGYTRELEVRHIQSFSKSALKDMKFTPQHEISDVDRAVVGHLLSLTIGFKKKNIEALLYSACALGMTDTVAQMFSSSRKIFGTIRSDPQIMSGLLHMSFIYDHPELCQHIIGCGAIFVETWSWAAGRDDALLQSIVALQSPTNEDLEDLLFTACQNCNDQLIMSIVSRWPHVLETSREKLVSYAIECMEFDRVDLLEFFARTIVTRPADPPSLGRYHALQTETTIDLVMVKDYLLWEAHSYNKLRCVRCLNYLVDGLPDQTVKQHSSKWIKLIRRDRMIQDDDVQDVKRQRTNSHSTN